MLRAPSWLLAPSLSILSSISLSQSPPAPASFADTRAKVRAAVANADYELALSLADIAIDQAPTDLPRRILRIEVLLRSGKASLAAEAVDASTPLTEDAVGPAYRALRKALQGGSTDADSAAELLFEEVSFHRNRSRPDLMLPLLWHLQAQRPEDWRLMLSLGEAYGVNSPFFDAVLADEQFAKLRVALRRDDSDQEWSRLVAFLDQTRQPLSRHDLGQRLLEFIAQLVENEPIRLWKRTDAAVTNLHERFHVARTLGAQEEALDIALQLREINSEDPVAHYLVGIVAGSRGPAHKPSLARGAFQQFLRLSEPDRFEATTAPPELSHEQLESQLRQLHLVEELSSFTALRLQVRHWMKDLSQKKQLLEVPDQASLAKQVVKLEQRWATRQDKVTGQESKLQQEEQRLKSLAAQLESQIRNRPRSRIDTRGDIQRTRDQIQATKIKISSVRRRLRWEQDQLADVEADLMPMRDRLEKFTR